ncbi:phosphatidylcholine synthase [Allofrancisella guangzhouensis]|uniref:Phosphatidylcholine synthase n=1 Tax=Allofrancisella guangzhouensis TaxID=594679 RepID=A0A0A8E557_9GAMM|nr:phosphatidylcholine synthase [Allofrancisella guangzhouensis]AJC49375.1 phosphatidylcholine synthase [Allofrancisella guangzhouensis]MBK2026983.1 phosphatidylcholine synthase [Allofrancisella guangzhouensis]MBK2043891.1 phosphatidylcholine synthase [Allofrancisella guangzhouensis]MBK2044996.1 phosphatidylcholine synthase [Allofrancisella guangzhouensis]
MQNLQKIYAWLVHLFTSLGAVFGIFAIIFSIEAAKANVLGDIELYYYNMRLSLFSIIASVFIDSVDGSFARLVDIKKIAPLDGALLDNIIDFTTYSIVPCVWIYVTDTVSHEWLLAIISIITISSSYQFCQPNAKTNDHFFVGFPSYWNVIIMYMLCFQSPRWINEIIIIILAIFSFVPIKYIYLSRTEHISDSKIVKTFTFLFTMLAAIATFIAVLIYPIKTPSLLIAIIISFSIFYIAFSFKLNFKILKTN